MKQKFDIGIIGAGLSGLHLANALLKKRIINFILFEKESVIKNDKTYSFWKGPGLFDITRTLSVKPRKEWSQIEIKTQNKSHIIDLGKYRYVCYASKTVLEELYQRVSKNGIKIQRGCSIKHIEKGKNHWLIHLKSKKIPFQYIVDSRPNKKFDDKYPSLKQVFIGTEIISTKKIFDANIATLMDFSDSKNSVIFTYILPFTQNRALIETTCFTSETDFKLLEGLHKITLKKFFVKKILRSEKAVLPMSPYPDLNHSDKYFRIGNFGGASRPASGYAFTRIALWANQIDTQKIFSYEMIHYKKNNLTNWLDKVLLSAIRSNPQSAPKIFKYFFTKVPISSVIRFLADQPKLIDYLFIIFKLPKIIMCKGLINLYVK